VIHVVDVGDPANLATGGTLDVGAGWLSSFTKVDGGVVGTRYGYDAANGSTNVFRVDVSDPVALRSRGPRISTDTPTRAPCWAT